VNDRGKIGAGTVFDSNLLSRCGICISSLRLKIVTRNIADFRPMGVDLINPWA
jgi:hypothetical protein